MKTNNGAYRFGIGFLLAAVLLVGGCSPTVSLLGKAKQRAAAGDYAPNSKMEVQCTAQDEGCNQLHFLKGDACFRLAEQDVDPRANFSCAAEHLKLGIDQTKQWQTGNLTLNRSRAYENLCESLRRLRGLEGERAGDINNLLLAAARQFRTLEPRSPAAVYFVENARYNGLHSCLLHPERCPALCGELASIVQNLNGAAAQAGGTAYEAPIRELAREVSKDRELTGCR